MAKTSSSTSSTSSPSQHVEHKPAMVAVFNHTNHQIGIAITRRKAGTSGQGPEAYTIEFLPGNNEKTRAELDLCEAHPAWPDHVERRERRGLTGKKVKTVSLQVDLHDPEFEVESEELGRRMKQLHEKRVG